MYGIIQDKKLIYRLPICIASTIHLIIVLMNWNYGNAVFVVVSKTNSLYRIGPATHQLPVATTPENPPTWKKRKICHHQKCGDKMR